MSSQADDALDRMLSVIEAEGSCIELRMQSGPGCEAGHREMVNMLIKEARLRLEGKRLAQILKMLERLR